MENRHVRYMFKGESLTLKQAYDAAHVPMVFEVDAALWPACHASRRAFLSNLAQGKSVYGVTVGVGALKGHAFDGAAQDNMNRSLVLAHSGGIRDALPASTVRLAMILRLNTLLLGRSGCSVELIESLLRLLNTGITPLVRGYGSIGCGDIMQTGQVGYALTGGGLAQCGDAIAPMSELMAHAGCPPHVMQVKDAIAMVSNNSFALAESIELAHRAMRSMDVLLVAALSAGVALHASPTPWRVAARYGRGHAAAIGAWLAAQFDSEPWAQEITVHDPLSIRFLAEIYGALYDEAQLWTDAMARLTGFLDENPIMMDGQVTTSGGSYLLDLAIRTDAFRVAVAHALRNAYNLCAHMIAGRRAGLNVNLIATGSAMTGFGPFLKVAGALASKGFSESAAVSPMPLILADGLEDECNHLPLSLSKLRRQVEAMEDMSAVMSLMTAQALDITGAARPAAVDGLYQLVRAILPFSQQDQPLSDAVEVLRDSLMSEHAELSQAVAGCVLPLRQVFD
ncbi:MAG: aromatic amino acid lyase [Formosimonas sp.]